MIVEFHLLGIGSTDIDNELLYSISRSGNIGMEYIDNTSGGCKIINRPYTPSADRNISLCVDQEDSEKIELIRIGECNLFVNRVHMHTIGIGIAVISVFII